MDQTTWEMGIGVINGDVPIENLCGSGWLCVELLASYK